MPSRRLRRRAAAQARAAVRPQRQAQRAQIGATRHDTRQQVRSLSSENRALQGTFNQARSDFRHIPGLSGSDQRIALEQVALRRATTAAGIGSAQAEARQTGREAITQLRQTMPQADVASALSDLIAQRQANKHDVKMARLSSKLDLKNSLAEAAASAKADKGKGGLTPNERRGVNQSRKNALALVRAAYHHSQVGSKGAPPVPQSQSQWREWADKLYGVYHTTVDRGDINWAVTHFRNAKTLRQFGPALRSFGFR